MMKQGVMFAVLSLGATTACGGKTSARPSNEADHGAGGWAPTLAVTAADVPGMLAFARLEDQDAAGMMPQPEGRLVVWPVDSGDGIDERVTSYQLLGPSGAPVRGERGPVIEIAHGCDGGTISASPITPSGDAVVAGGVVWALPEPVPAGWAPSAVVLERGEATVGRTSWTAGPLTITSATSTPTVGALTVRAGDRVLGELPYERGTMDGDSEASIDLSGDHHNPGVPRPAAAWLLAPDGPMLLALYTEGFEGSGVSAYLVGEDALAPVESMDDGYYYCAF